MIIGQKENIVGISKTCAIQGEFYYIEKQFNFSLEILQSIGYEHVTRNKSPPYRNIF